MNNRKTDVFKRITALVIAFAMLFSVSAFAEEGRGKSNHVKNAGKAIILVGDSRVWHMSALCSNEARRNYYFVYANGKGIFDWANNYNGFKSDTIAAMRKYPGAPVVLMLGVNYNQASTDYPRLEAYNAFINTYWAHRFIVSTVGKTAGQSGNYSNTRIRAFNNKIKSWYAPTIVPVYDLYALLDAKITSRSDTRNGDGVHYKTATYNKILYNLRAFAGR